MKILGKLEMLEPKTDLKRNLTSRAMYYGKVETVLKVGLHVFVLLFAFFFTINFAKAEAVNILSDKKIHILVGFAPGGPTDIIARLLGSKLSSKLKVEVIIENRVGASGNVASLSVAQADSNRLTILLTPSAFAINETLFPNRQFSYFQNFIPVASIAETALVLVTHPSILVKNVQELKAYADKNHGAFYATAGLGTVTHMAGALFAHNQSIKLEPIHYKGGGDLLRDIVSGHVKITFSTIPPVAEFIKSGQLVAIATTGLERDSTLSNIPTYSEAGMQQSDVVLWLGMLASRTTPKPVAELIAKTLDQILKDKEIQDILRTQGFYSRYRGPEEFDAFIRSEIERWSELLNHVNIPLVQ